MSGRKKRVNLCVDGDIFDIVKALGLSISAVCERALRLRVEALRGAEEAERQGNLPRLQFLIQLRFIQEVRVPPRVLAGKAVPERRE